MAQQKKRILIPSGYSKLEREAIAERIIERIIKRTKSGKDVDGDKFAAYSKAYKKSLDFKIAGKSSKVNLTLSDEMLNSIEHLSDQYNSVTVGIPADDKRNNGKAEGNQKGTYGNKRQVAPKREFLGLSNGELQAILKEFPKESSLERAARIVAARRAAKALAEDIDVTNT